MGKLYLADDLKLPLEWVQMATIVYGGRGSGKTYFGSVAAEEAWKQHVRFCVVDVKGDWWGLKSSADGKSEGIPVIVFGGDHADVPLDENAGAQVADIIASLEQPSILDFENLSKGKQIKFLAAFFERLYDVNRNPILLLLDEIQRYAPQMVRFNTPEMTMCLGAVEDLVKLGRKHGIGVLAFTQRGSGVNKEVSELCDLLTAFRTPGPLDQGRVKEWLEANVTLEKQKVVMEKIANLATGTAIIASGHPDLDVFKTITIRRRETFDSSATPKIGVRRVEPKVLSKPDLAKLQVQMAATIAKAKAEDPKALQARIRELEKQLSQRHAVMPSKPQIIRETKRVEVPVWPREALPEELRQKARELRVAAGELEQWAKIKPGTPSVAILVEGPPFRDGPAVRNLPRLESPPRVITGLGDGLKSTSGGQQRILNALAWLEGVGIRPASRPQTAVLARLAPTSGTFKTYAGGLRTAGKVHYPTPGTIELTEEGRREASTDGVPSTPHDLQAQVLELCTGGQKEILRTLLDAYPRALQREQIREAIGMENSLSLIHI